MVKIRHRRGEFYGVGKSEASFRLSLWNAYGPQDQVFRRARLKDGDCLEGSRKKSGSPAHPVG